MADDREITVEEDGQILSEATVSMTEGSDEARAEVHVAPGHLPPGTRHRMADAIHEVVVDQEAAHLTATVPLGDCEMVEAISDHLHDVDLRAAGATSIIRGDVDSD